MTNNIKNNSHQVNWFKKPITSQRNRNVAQMWHKTA